MRRPLGPLVGALALLLGFAPALAEPALAAAPQAQPSVEQPGLRTIAAPYRPRATRTFAMVAATWQGGRPELRVRTRRAHGWSSWLPLSRISGERATEALWVGDSTGVQLRAVGKSQGLRVVLINPKRHRSDRAAGLTQVRSEPRLLGQGTPGWAIVPAPPMQTRQAWGADETWRDKDFKYIDRLQQLHVHHTASVNGYAQAEVPRMIRGMYAYHVKTLGWGDIGYNYLVDRFGRIWIGRAGDQQRLIKGAHTLGFNETGVGVSIIGNFDKVEVPLVALNAVADLGAWKFSTYGVDPLGTASVKSLGSDLFPRGQVVTLPTVDGHRDTNQTDCPGDYVYQDLAWLRAAIAERITAAGGTRWGAATP